MDEIQEILTYHFKDETRTLKRFASGVMNYTFKVTLSSRNCVLKMYPKERAWVHSVESKVLDIAYDRGIQVPKILFKSDFNVTPDHNYIICEYIDGYDLKNSYNSLDQNIKNDVVSKLTKNLKSLNQIRCNGLGELNDGLTSKTSKWITFLDKSIDNGLSYSKRLDNINFTHLTSYIESQKGKIELNIKPSLVWADLSKDNVLLDRDFNVKLIDFESMMSGDINLQFGYLFAKEGHSTFFNDLLSAYFIEGNPDMDMIYFYSILRLIRILPYIESELPSKVSRDPLEAVFPGTYSLLANF